MSYFRGKDVEYFELLEFWKFQCAEF